MRRTGGRRIGRNLAGVLMNLIYLLAGTVGINPELGVIGVFLALA
jgi:hypothetical protein